MSNSAMVDQKGRLKIPPTLLPTLKGSGTEFFIHRRRWLLGPHLPEAGLERRMDKQGRVLIPIVLRSSAHMRVGWIQGRKHP